MGRSGSQAAPAPARSVIGHLTSTAQREPTRPALLRRCFSRWEPVSAAEFHDEVRQVAKGIAAAGVQPGDRVGILSGTRYEWTVADYAIWYTGAVPVPLPGDATAEQVEWILSDAGAVALFTGSREQRDVVERVAGALPNVRSVWVFDDGALSALAAGGRVVGDDDLDARRDTASPEGVATIVYAHGGDLRPTGCVLTHRNLAFAVESLAEGLPQLFTPGSATLLFLPLARMLGRVVQLGCIYAGVRLAHSEDPRTLAADLAEVGPEVLVSYPQAYRAILQRVRQQARASGIGPLYDEAEATAVAYSRALDSGGPGPLLRARHALSDRLVGPRIRAALGGRVAYAVSGGAALDPWLGHLMRGSGITVLEGYGLSASSAAATVNRPGSVRLGTVGLPIPGTEVRIAPDGEVLLRGPNVFAGYWNDPMSSADAVDPHGWLRTGDLGTVDPEGFLRITGRRPHRSIAVGGRAGTDAPVQPAGDLAGAL